MRIIIEELFAKLAPVLGSEKADRLWLLYQTETDLEKKRELEGIVHSLAAKYLNENYQNNRILLPPPAITNNNGYLFGKVYYGEEPRGDFFLPEQQLLLHCSCFGTTGAGKTNMGFLLVKQLLEKGKPFMVFDWKRNYRDILETEWARGKKITVYTVGRDVAPFSFDPLQPPPGTNQETWESKVIDILCHSHFLGHGVRYWLNMLLNATDKHSLQNLYNAIQQTKAVGRRREWLDSTLRAVASLCTGQAGKVFNAAPKVRIDHLLSSNVIFELDALSDDAKTFFVEALLGWIHQYRMAEKGREQFKHAILIEEAHHVLLKRKEYGQEKETVMDVIFREIRELGEALVVFDQHPSMISKPALGNSGTTIIMRLKHAEDVRAAADSSLLDFKQRDYVGQLPTGWAIVRVPDIPKPFLLRIPFIAVKKGFTTDEMLKGKYPGYSGQSEVILPPLDPMQDIPPIPGKDKEDKAEEEKLSDAEIGFLKDLIDHPMSGVVERYRRLCLTMQKGTDLKKNLERKQYLRQQKVSTGKAAISYLELTRAGFDALRCCIQDVGNSTIFSQRRGGAEHKYWIEKISDELRSRGFHVEKEYPIGAGKTVDIVARKNGGTVAVEIETGKSYPVTNVAKDVESEFDKVVVITTSEKERRKMLDQLSKHPPELNSVQSAKYVH